MSIMDWDSTCCICGDGGDDLRGTPEGISSLAGQFVEYWKNEVLPFDSERITTKSVVDDNGVQHPDFIGPMVRHNAQYHHNCYIRYTPYKMARTLKTLENKRRKAQAQESSSVPSVRVSRDLSSRRRNVVCVYRSRRVIGQLGP